MTTDRALDLILANDDTLTLRGAEDVLSNLECDLDFDECDDDDVLAWLDDRDSERGL